jgi:hypothetical protein
MPLLRIILLVVTALLWVLAGYVLVKNTMIHSYSLSDYLSMGGMFIYLGLNFVYLLLGNTWPGFRWRVFRLVDLWFDAKESELRQRADRSRQDKSHITGQ